MNEQERITQLESELAELQSRLPRHSVPPAMIIELEELEDKLEMLKARINRDAD